MSLVSSEKRNALKGLPVLFFLLITHCTFSQTESKIIPPSPESSSLFKFSEVPVSMFTGLPNISVPLYEIKLKQLSIPIQLGYHSRGIRVEEIAPRIGLGWALSYGGLISRQVRDQPDDGTAGFIHLNYYNNIFTDNTLRASMEETDLNTGIDNLPDQFLFDMPGGGGKFVFDHVSKQIFQQKFSDTKITPLWGNGGDGITGWIVIDEMGNKFYFGLSKDGLRKAVDYDQLNNNYSYSRLHGLAVLGNDGDDRTINSWHLMEVETPFNERVEFFYKEEISALYRRSYDKVSGSDVLCFFSHVNTQQQQIKEIHFNNGKVKFTEQQTIREDLEGAYALEKVGIYNSANILSKEFLFQYHYTTSPANNNQLHYLKTVEPKSNKRLFLTSIQERGKSGSTIPSYLFQYNTTPLPNRFSTSQDIWGYYNGKNNGEYLTFFNNGRSAVSREVDVVLSEAGLLNKITYPTGGSTSFSYEHNLVMPPLFMSELIFPKSIITRTEAMSDGFLKNSLYYNNGIYSKSVTIGAKKTGSVAFSFDLPFCPGPYQDDPSYCHYQVYLRGESINYYLYPPERNRTLNLTPGTYSLEVIPGSDHDPADVSNLFIVDLKWNETVTTIEGGSSDAAAPLLAAGKRIQKIEYTTEEGTISQKEYSYVDAQERTTGLLLGLPNFYYRSKTVDVGNEEWVVTADPYGTLPGSPLSTYQGNSVGYSMVTEYYGTKLNNHGKIEYEFTTTEDGGKYYKFPYHLPIDNEWLRGKPLATRIYEGVTSNTYTLKKEVNNKYLYAGNSPSPGPLMQPFLPANSSFVYSKSRTNFYLPLLITTSDLGAYATYYVTGGTCDLDETTETFYEQGLAKVVNKTKFSYNYARHYQVQSTEKSQSDGSSEIILTSYPNDYASGSTFIDAMKNNNLLAYPIEEVKYKNVSGTNYILSGRITAYRNDAPAMPDQILSLHNSTSIPLASFKFSSQLMGVIPTSETLSTYSPDIRYKPVLTYNQYDSKGNVLQLTKTDDSPASYIWDYKSRLPIAEVKNASQGEIAYTSFEADGKGNWAFSGIPISDISAPTGTQVYDLNNGGITKAMLSTGSKFFLSYWVKSSVSPAVSGSGASSISTPKLLTTINGWAQFGVEISNTSSITIVGNVIIDEVRLHPVGAIMATYTYDPLTGMTSSTDANGSTSHFKYDSLNRLQYIKDKDRNVLQVYQYNYARD